MLCHIKPIVLLDVDCVDERSCVAIFGVMFNTVEANVVGGESTCKSEPIQDHIVDP